MHLLGHSFIKFSNVQIPDMLPDRTQTTYNLRSRKHDCSLTVRQSVTMLSSSSLVCYTKTFISKLVTTLSTKVIRPYRFLGGCGLSTAFITEINE